jgi:hypothetical protein
MMKTKLPPTRRKFAHAWDEIRYLREKLLYWLYDRQQQERAHSYARRLQALLKQADPKQESILGQECRSLLSELEGDLHAAIRLREDEIRKIRRLRRISENTPQWDLACKGYGHNALSDRLDLLAFLYDQIGETRKAVLLLEESKAYCQQHGIPFDAQDGLDELTRSLQLTATENGKKGRKSKSA